jgi:hypothetical protein
MSTAEAISIYDNNLVGIDQLAKEDSNAPTDPIKDTSPDRERTWTELVGHIWRTPEDGRLPLMFQKRCLLRLRVPSDPNVATTYLRDLAGDECIVPPWTTLLSKLSRSNISITDYFDDQLTGVQYDLHTKGTEAFSNLLNADDKVNTSARGPATCTSGPWRRIMYVYCFPLTSSS